MRTNDDDTLLERMISGEEILHGRIFNVERWRVTLPDGRPAERDIVRHMGAVAVVAIDDLGRVALVRQFRAAVNRVLAEIPAGKLDSKKEPRPEAAVRELQEETGLAAERMELLTEFVTGAGFSDEIISIYLARGLTQLQTHFDDDEFIHTVWMPLEDAIGMAVRGELCDSKTIAGLFLARERMIEEGTWRRADC